MIWLFMLVVLFAVMLIKLGAYSAWVGILVLGLKVAVLVIVYLVTAAFLRKIFGKKKYFKRCLIVC